MRGNYVYLAGPIDRAIAGSQSIVAMARDALEARSIGFYDPRQAWSLGEPVRSSHALDEVNGRALSNATVMLAIIHGPSIGVPAEMMQARHAGVPVVAFCTNPRDLESAALNVLATHSSHTNMTAAIQAVVDIFNDEYDGRQALINRDHDVRDLPLPEQAKPGDIGLDLYVSDDIAIPPKEWRGVASRVRVAPPPGLWFVIAGRSSTLSGRGLIILWSVIDNGYRGPLFALCYNVTDNEVLIKRGERVAQLLPLPLTELRFTETDTLPQSHRGAAGFGSTGS